MFVCKLCHLHYSSLRAYAHHYRFHRNENNINFPCVVKGCLQSFASYNNFARHVSSSHSEARHALQSTHFSNAAVKLKCNVLLCQQECSDYTKFVKHLKQHLVVGVAVSCPYKKCNKVFKVRSSFSAHLSRNHSSGSVGDIVDNPVDATCFEHVDTDLTVTHSVDAIGTCDDASMDIHEEVQMNQADFKVKYFNSVASFYMMLQGKYLVPVSTISKIVEELGVTHDLEYEFLMNNIRVAMLKNNVPQDQAEDIISTVMRNDIFNEAHNADNGLLRSDHMRQKFYRDNFAFVAPVPLLLGNDKHGQQVICHYVPIKETIKSLFRNACVIKQHENPLPRDATIMTDVMDGTIYKSNVFFANNLNALKIILFQDAFEIVNPLGSAKKKHKLLGVYFTLADFYPHNRSSVGQLQLVLLCKESNCKYFGDFKVFGQLIQDLKELETEGIEIVPGKIVKAAVVCIAGDNLGSHYIGGFVESFSAEYSCRYCLAKREDFVSSSWNCCAEMRTVDNYYKSVEQLKTNPNENNFCGIKRDSLFNQLANFHVTSGLPPCLGHDLFEGVICYDLALCLRYFVKQQWFSYDLLNNRIHQFRFTSADAANKPAEVSATGDRLGGHAIQNWTLLRFIGLIIGDKVANKDNSVWQLVLLMIKMTALICSARLSKAEVAYMKIVIQEYLETRHELFPDVSLRPKHHYLSHYASLTLKFGPLIRLWTMRFESKHSYFKRCMRSAQNYRNVSGMLAERHQIFQAYQLAGSFFPSEIEFKNCSAFHIGLHCIEIQEALRDYNFTSDDTVVTDSVSIKGSLFSQDCYVIVHGNNEDETLDISANCILLVLVQNHTPYFIARRHRCSVDTDLGVLRISKTEQDSVVCFSTTSTKHDHPLYSYSVRGQLFIAPKSAVTYDTYN